MQHVFFGAHPPSLGHYNQAVLLVLDPSAELAGLRLALRETQRVHPALRSRFRRGATGWSQEIVADLDVELEEHDLSALPADERDAELERICNAFQRSLDLGVGPIFRATMFRLGPAARRLFLVAHHLVVDAVSWQVLLADIEAAYAQVRRGDRPALPPEFCGPAEFRRRLTARGSSDVLEHERVYWSSITARAGDLLAGSPGRETGRPRPASITRAFSAAETRSLLTEVHRAHQTNVPDLLLAALGRALGELAQRERVVVDVEGHGRDALGDADLSRSVGWFTILYPVALPCGASAGPASLIRGVKESLRSVPHGGIGFGLLHWTDESLPAPHTDVCFNYLGYARAGEGNGLVRALAPEGSGDRTAADLPRRYRLEINAAIVDGALVMDYSFDAGRVSEATIAELADRTSTALRVLIADCLGELDALLGDLDLSDLIGS
jgi:non-ribosomal peptide synthase protein (TIGR01720 family)